MAGSRAGSAKLRGPHRRWPAPCLPRRSAQACASASCSRCAGTTSTSSKAGSPLSTPRPRRAPAARSTCGPSCAMSSPHTRQTLHSASPRTTYSPPRRVGPTPAEHRQAPQTCRAASERDAGRPGCRPDPNGALASLTPTHLRLAALPARREPRLCNAPNGAHRPQARPTYLHQGHGRATPTRPRRTSHPRARRRPLDRGGRRAPRADTRVSRGTPICAEASLSPRHGRLSMPEERRLLRRGGVGGRSRARLRRACSQLRFKFIARAGRPCEAANTA
jgi:hypothetical protein